MLSWIAIIKTAMPHFQFHFILRVTVELDQLQNTARKLYMIIIVCKTRDKLIW